MSSSDSLSSSGSDTGSTCSSSSSGPSGDTLGSKCVNCFEDIPKMGIECVVCTKVRVRLCLECFTLGAEIGPHLSTHAFRYFHSGRCPPMLPPEPLNGAGPSACTPVTKKVSTRATSTEGTVWYEEEQIRLLRGLELYGYGNWSEIANHIATKTAQEAKEEYNRRYINGPVGQATWSEEAMSKRDVPFPIDHTIKPMKPPAGTEGSETEKDKEGSSASESDEEAEPQKKPQQKSKKIVVGPLSPSLTSKLPPLDINREEMRLLGCNPKRDDYEMEWDNEAEKLVANLSFDPGDSEVEVGLKLAVVDIYVRRLRERARRKKIVRDHQLVAKFFRPKGKGKEQAGTEDKEEPMPSTSRAAAAAAANKLPEYPLPEGVSPTEHLSQYKKCIENILRPFAQFHTKKDHDTLSHNLVMARNLALRLQALKEYRMMGFRTIAEIVEYDKQKEKQAEKQRLDALAESSDEEANEDNDDEGKDDEDEAEEAEEEDAGDEYSSDDADDDNDTDFQLDSSFGSGDSPSSASSLGRIKSLSVTRSGGKRGRPLKERRSLRNICPPKKKKPRTKRFFHKKSHTPSALERQRQHKLRKMKEKSQTQKQEPEHNEPEEEEEEEDDDDDEQVKPVARRGGKKRNVISSASSSSSRSPRRKSRKSARGCASTTTSKRRSGYTK